MYLLMALVGLVAVPIALGAALVGGRHLAARGLGVPAFRLRPLDASGAYFAAPLWRRALVPVSGMAAAYVVACTPFLLALMIAGRQVTSTGVDPLPGGPAEAAGVKSGDRVLAVDGVPVETWDAARDRIQQGTGPTVELTVERGSERVVIAVTPEPPRRVRIVPRYVMVRPGLGSAVGDALATPVSIWTTTMVGYVRVVGGREKAELAGPVGIVRETSRGGLGPALYFTGLLATYFWPATLVLALVLAPKRRPSAVEGR